jgi:hypothetical protein
MNWNVSNCHQENKPDHFDDDEINFICEHQSCTSCKKGFSEINYSICTNTKTRENRTDSFYQIQEEEKKKKYLQMNFDALNSNIESTIDEIKSKFLNKILLLFSSSLFHFNNRKNIKRNCVI